jgi:hypothetical protein
MIIVNPYILNQGTLLSYVSNGDSNGLFYYIGTSALTVAWINPSTSGQITASSSGNFNASYEPPRATDRTDDYPWHSNGAASWIKFDLELYRIRVDDYTLRTRTDYQYGTYLTDWILEGSNDDSDWTAIDTRNGQTYTHSTTTRYTTTPTVGYRYLRIRDTSANSHMVIGEVEFYGSLTLNSE